MSESAPEPLSPAPGEALAGEAHPPGAPSPQEPKPESDWNEDLYQATCTVLVEPQKTLSPWQSIGCLAVSVLLFILSFLGSMDLQALGFIIPVLFLHETGHILGMRAFGYRNVQMFFIPFFGAAVSGKKHAAPVWQQAVVLLLGPLPGVCLGIALELWLRPVGDAWAAHVVLWLLLVNGANLLPIVPLDGGRLLDVLLFTRRPMLTVGFQILAGVWALFALALLSGSWIFGALGGLMLLAVPARYRKASRQSVFRNNPLELPERLEDLGDVQRRDLFGWTERLNPLSRDPVSRAGHMRSLHESMVSRRPGVLVWGLLLALYVSGLAGSFAVGLIAVRDNSEHNNRVRLQEERARLQEQAAALVAGFDETVQQLNNLRARHGRLRDPKGRDHAEAGRLQKQVDRRWQELHAQWKEAPPGVRGLAVHQILARSDRRRSDPADDFTRLYHSLGYIPSAK